MSDRLATKVGGRSSNTPSAADKYRKMQREAASRRGALTWSDADSDDLRDTVASVTEDGAAVLLAKTSDGGALVLRVIADRESVPFYAPDMASLNEMMREVRDLNAAP